MDTALRAEVDRLLGEGVFEGMDFEAIETAGRRLPLEVMGRALACRLNADHSDTQAGQSCDRCGAPARYAGRRRKTFITALGPLALARARYHCDQCHAGFYPRDRAQCQVILGDGALWTWTLADELFPDAIQIVDICHAKGYLFEAARAIYGAGTDLAGQWGKQRRDELDQGRIDAILAALAEHPSCPQAEACSSYLTNNRKRMDYPRFRAMGLCITTGVVEAGCKHVVATRFKRGGMRWTVNGANDIMALRCAVLNNRFDDFWERRAGV